MVISRSRSNLRIFSSFGLKLVLFYIWCRVISIHFSHISSIVCQPMKIYPSHFEVKGQGQRPGFRFFSTFCLEFAFFHLQYRIISRGLFIFMDISDTCLPTKNNLPSRSCQGQGQMSEFLPFGA